MARSRFSSCFVLSARGAQLGPLFAAPSSRPVVSFSFLRLSLWLPLTALFACSPLRLPCFVRLRRLVAAGGPVCVPSSAAPVPGPVCRPLPASAALGRSCSSSCLPPRRYSSRRGCRGVFFYRIRLFRDAPVRGLVCLLSSTVVGRCVRRLAGFRRFGFQLPAISAACRPSLPPGWPLLAVPPRVPAF